MQELLVPVSIGELLDKVTILRIKERRILDPSKVANIKAELEALLKVCAQAGINLALPAMLELEKVNERLWVIEDQIRELERAKDFGPAFVDLARAVYVTNDQRFRLKSELNALLGSRLREEKSYPEFA